MRWRSISIALGEMGRPVQDRWTKGLSGREGTSGGTVRLCFTRVKVTVFLAVGQGDNGN